MSGVKAKQVQPGHKAKLAQLGYRAMSGVKELLDRLDPRAKLDRLGYRAK
jgi:hypothetical protein